MEEEWQEPVAPLFGGPCWDQNYHHPGCGNVKVHAKNSVSSPHLFADDVWPGALAIADYLVDHRHLYCDGKAVLELGAGTALPSLVCAKLGSCRRLVISDYPDDDILRNIRELLAENDLGSEEERTVFVRGHAWGQSVAPLFAFPAQDTDRDTCTGTCTERDRERNRCRDSQGELFDTVLLAELLWRDTYPLHRALLTSLCLTLKPGSGRALLAFAHRPTSSSPSSCSGHTAAHDLEFLALAASVEFGLQARPLGSRLLPDPCAGDLQQQATGPEGGSAVVSVLLVELTMPLTPLLPPAGCSAPAAQDSDPT